MKSPKSFNMGKLIIWGAIFLLFNLASVNQTGAQSCTPPSSGLVSWWPGDGNAMDIEDNNDGTLVNGATFTTSLVDQAFSLDGVNDSVSVASNPNLDPSSFTYEFWLTNPGQICSGQSRYCRIISRGYGDFFELAVQVGSPNLWVFARNSVGWTDTGFAVPNSWTHVAATYDEGSRVLTIYANGQPIYTRPNTDPIMPSGPLYLGVRRGSLGEHYRGNIDELKFYQRALIASEIQGIFQAGSAGTCQSTPPEVDAGGDYTGFEGAPIPLNGASASDIDNDPLKYDWDVDSALCIFSDDSVLNPILTCGDNGDFIATLTVSDNINDPVNSTATVSVNNVAPSPNAGSDQTIFRNELVTVSGIWSDPADDLDNEYTWSWDLDGDGLPDDSGSASFGDTISRNTSFVVDGIATLTFSVTDKDEGEASDTVVIEVLNRAPVADNQSAITDEDMAVDITLTGSDLDNDTLTFSLLGSPNNGVLSGTPPNLTYTPTADFNGSDSFTFKVNDGLAASNEATVNIIINPINDPSEAIDDTAVTDEDMAVIIDVHDNDNAGPANEDQSLTTTTVSNPANGLAAINPEGSITYNPNLNFNGTDEFSYTVCDSDNACATATVTVLIALVNDPPVATDDKTTTPEDTLVTINVVANDSDIDGNLDPNSATELSQPANGSLVNNGDGTFDYTPEPDFNDSDSFTYEICDTDAVCDDATVNIVITPVNDNPVCTIAVPSSDTLWPPNHQFELITVSGVTDVEGDPITITINSIFQDEPIDSNGDGSHTPDGQGIGTATAQVRVERQGGGNGRYYHIGFTASDSKDGACSGIVLVSVPKSQGKKGAAVDNGPLYDSTIP